MYLLTHLLTVKMLVVD